MTVRAEDALGWISTIREKIDQVERAVREIAVPPLHRGPQRIVMPDDELRMAVRMYGEGVPLCRVAERMGYTTEVLRRELLRAGVRIRGRGPTRPRGDAPAGAH